ncbi:MAG TPA: hypothetical protein EYG03_08445 [Planctomycetes bacterium]|nr:hypothetical protein [Planctomycetota bacterium]
MNRENPAEALRLWAMIGPQSAKPQYLQDGEYLQAGRNPPQVSDDAVRNAPAVVQDSEAVTQAE